VVAEVKLNEGEMIERGTALITLVPPSPERASGERRGPPIPLIATLYVPSTEGKRVRPGQMVEIMPSTAKREEFGFIFGRVTSVAEVPATQEGMQRTLKNRQVVQALTQSGAPFEVRAELEINPDTPTGFRWSSSRGPETTLSGGSPAKGEIVVRSQTLMQIAIPAFRRFFLSSVI
jgi:HlyD family secretion protein